MHRNLRSRCALVRIVAASLLILGLVGAARADLLFLKDGFVIQGQIKRDYKLLVEKGEGVDIPVGPFYIEDGPRRINFSPSQIRIVEKRERGQEEILNAQRFLTVPVKPVVPLLEVLAATPFDMKWDRTITIRGPVGAVEVPQHLGFITPYWARVDATKFFLWSTSYLTREFSAQELVSIVASHPDIVEKPGMAAAEIVRRRFRLVDFITQAGHFNAAERELLGILKDYPAESAKVNLTLTGLNRVRGRERYEDIKRMHIAAQFKAVRMELDKFQKKDVADQVLADVNDLRTDYIAIAAKIAEIDRLLGTLSTDVTDTKGRPIMVEAAKVIRKELQADTLPRLEAFLSQAKQYERQKVAGKTPDLRPDELMALAVTGWLLGGSAAETKPAAAIRLWHTRHTIISYLRTDDPAQREAIRTAFQRDTSDHRLDEILQIIPTLPPPEAETNLDTVNPMHQTAGGRGGSSYLVQLPTEYRHGRKYPVLVVLHEANEKPQDMLSRWREAATEHGYIVVAPLWQNGALGGGYNYSDKEHATVLGALRDLRRKYNIDSDRVFLFGLGQGGAMAYDVGLSHPDLFAGVVTMGARPELFAEKYFRNGQYLPFYSISGTTDYASAKSLRSYYEEWNTRGYPAVWVEYRGRGVEWFGGEVPNILDWIRAKRRAFPMQQLGTDGFGGKFGNELTTMRTTDNFFYWLSTDSIQDRCLNSAVGFKPTLTPALLHARIDPPSNCITVTAKGVKGVTIWLGRNGRGESMIDFDKPVTIRVELKALWANKKIDPSLATLLEDLYQRGDRQRPFLAKVDLNW